MPRCRRGCARRPVRRGRPDRGSRPRPVLRQQRVGQHHQLAHRRQRDLAVCPAWSVPGTCAPDRIVPRAERPAYPRPTAVDCGPSTGSRIGATPASGRDGGSGISASRPEAVTRPGIEVSTSTPRDSSSSSAISASSATSCRSAWSSRFTASSRWPPAAAGCAPPCGPSPARPEPCAVRRPARVDRGATRRSGNAAPIRASTCASALSVLASWPIACATPGTQRVHPRQRQPLHQRFFECPVPRSRRLVHHLVRGRADPRRQRLESSPTVPPLRCSAGERPDAHRADRVPCIISHAFPLLFLSCEP